MQISPETKKISEIFPIEGNLNYRIPIYQRNYSWQDKQIEMLIEDIAKEASGYYIGNVLITRNEDSSIQEIVDGQQRLTTISLIFLAVYEVTKKFIALNPLDVGSLLSDIKRKLLINGSLDNQRYTLLSGDNTVYKDILKTVLTDDKTYSAKKIRFSIRYQRIKQLLDEEYDTFYSLKDFYDKLNSIELLKITVTKLSDAFSIFSSLNSKGMPLTLVDLLKNEYLKQATKEKINESNALIGWDSLMNVFAESEEINTNDVTQFLLNNYDALESKERRSITKGEALDLYNKIIDKGSKYIHELKERSNWFDFIKDSDANVEVDTKVKKLIFDLSILDPSQSFPLLLFIFVRTKELKLSTDQLIMVLDSIISFFVRRNITLKPKASNVRSLFININREIQEKNLLGKDIVILIKKEILKESVSDQILKQTLIEDGLYDKNSSTTRFILIDLERKLQDDYIKKNKTVYFTKANPDTLNDSIDSPRGKRPKQRWTIEHILPEGPKLPTHWETMISPQDPSKAREIQEDHVHKLGNLTLTPYNSELGQKSFVDKKNKQDKGNFVGLKLPIVLNESIPNIGLNETIDSKVSWTIEDINRRTEELANKILDFYKL
jgi:uncharacterized protein with ParB-like and HNH nuclease domain